MSPESAAVFGLSCIGFGFLPGPAMVQTVSLSLLHGRRAGMLSALGIHLGGLVQVVAVAIGATALLETSPLAYRVLKAAGGAYLIWLGIERLRHPRLAATPTAVPRHVVWSSALIEISNPKSALFYLAFLLQFVVPGAALATGWQILLLGVAANLLFSIADVASVVSAHALRSRMMTGQRSVQVGQKLAGWLFIVLGVYAVVGH